MPDDQPLRCPVCQSSLAPGAVLCIACGYHLTLGHQLATNVERQPERKFDPNPYASPEMDPEETLSPKEGVVFDLTEAGAKQAAAVVADADWAFGVFLIGLCLCGLVWLVMFPWYSYRLYCWHSLSARFSELRNPNGFSPHGVLAAKFQESRGKLVFGIVAGAIFWMLLAFVLVAPMFGLIGRD